MSLNALMKRYKNRKRNAVLTLIVFFCIVFYLFLLYDNNDLRGYDREAKKIINISVDKAEGKIMERFFIVTFSILIGILYLELTDDSLGYTLETLIKTVNKQEKKIRYLEKIVHEKEK